MSSRPVPLTDMPWALMLILVAVGLLRTVLADLDIVVPESSLLYYVLALAPFAAWLVVAVVRPTRKPVMDFLILGLLYGLSLILVHQTAMERARRGAQHPRGRDHVRGAVRLGNPRAGPAALHRRDQLGDRHRDCARGGGDRRHRHLDPAHTVPPCEAGVTARSSSFFARVGRQRWKP